MDADATRARIVGFIREIGLDIVEESFADDALFSGIAVRHGGLAIDPSRLKHPGDILHEAGHLAVAPPEKRRAMHGNVCSDRAEEMMAIVWSYAAALHIGIDPEIVFHADGYRGGSQSLLENFRAGRYFAVPMLQWTGMAYEERRARELGAEAFPAMQRWVRES